MKHTLSAFTVAMIYMVGSRAASQSSEVRRKSSITMPSDRLADSYAIYSHLLPHGQIEGAEWKLTFWLLEETTVATVPADHPCDSGSDTSESVMSSNPHRDIHPPADQETAFRALLADFDAHCHERIQLTADYLHTNLPVHLADQAASKRLEAAEFQTRPSTATSAKQNEFAGAAGIHSFSQVYFTPDHSVAMVYTGLWCGGLCGMWRWVVLERKDGQWPLPWVTSLTVS
jgi:hypothetical protein